jgi:hypothetical protein
MTTSGAGTEAGTATGRLSESIRYIRRWRPSMVAAIADKWVHQFCSFRAVTWPSVELPGN